MRYFLLILLFSTGTLHTIAQDNETEDTMTSTTLVTIRKDPRLYTLAQKEAQFNQLAATSIKTAKGFRLMVLNTSNRAQALKVRTQLLQRYPDQKVYITYQSPYIKLKFGDFLSQDDANEYKAQIAASKIVTGNIYVVPDTIEIQPEENPSGDSGN